MSKHKKVALCFDEGQSAGSMLGMAKLSGPVTLKCGQSVGKTARPLGMITQTQDHSLSDLLFV
jgi:hypothetical protein